MKKSAEKYIAAGIYLLVALFQVLMMVPVLALTSISDFWLTIIIQLFATGWFVKTAIDIIDSKKVTNYGTSFFAYNLVFIVITGLCYESEKVLYSYGLQKMNITDVGDNILLIILCVKLVLVAAAALLATSETKQKQVKEKTEDKAEENATEEAVKETAE